MLQIRWHSRAGQGAVTGAKALADIMARTGKYVQAYSVYGAEKRGAPMSAYDKISDTPILDHSKWMTPDYVLVIDPSLVFQEDIVDNTKFFAYNVNTNQWDNSLSDMPDGVGEGGSIVYDGTFLYAQQGKPGWFGGNRGNTGWFGNGSSGWSSTHRRSGSSPSSSGSRTASGRNTVLELGRHFCTYLCFYCCCIKIQKNKINNSCCYC